MWRALVRHGGAFLLVTGLLGEACSSSSSQKGDGAAPRDATDAPPGKDGPGTGGKASTGGAGGHSTGGGGTGGAFATGGAGAGSGGAGSAGRGGTGTTGGAAGGGAAGGVASGGAAGKGGTGAGGTAGGVAGGGGKPVGGAGGAVVGGGGAGGSTGGGGAGAGAGGGGLGGSANADPGDSVLMHHKHLNRDGVYVQPSFTRAAAAGLTKDAGFHATVAGNVYAQPLFVDGKGGTDLVIVATQSNNVYALNAVSGAQVWMRSLGTPVPLSTMPCGNIDPYGVTGTPVIDFASRTLFVDAMTTPNNGTTKQHQVFALSVDDGSIKTGWPVDMGTTVHSGSTTFNAPPQSQRGALAVVKGTLYVPFGGLYGDCGNYHGWLVAIPISTPSQVQAWATTAQAGGIWGPSGVASDGSNVFVTTGNTQGTSTWGGGEAILSFPASATLSASPSYWAPTNWKQLDDQDADLSGAGPVVFDLPGSTPSHLAVAFGKDGNIYLEDANNLGGIAAPLSMSHVASNVIISAAAVYTTATATYVAFRANGSACTGGTSGDLTTVKMMPGSPPKFLGSWCAAGGAGAPMVTTTDGQAETIVWVVGADSNNLLKGFDGDTGAVVFGGGSSPIPGARRFNAPIAAKGRIYVAADNAVVAFKP